VVKQKKIRLESIDTNHMVADLLMKALGKPQFRFLIDLAGARPDKTRLDYGGMLKGNLQQRLLCMERPFREVPKMKIR
jgi:uncharacterized protein YcgL (UPF0745 family)